MSYIIQGHSSIPVLLPPLHTAFESRTSYQRFSSVQLTAADVTALQQLNQGEYKYRRISISDLVDATPRSLSSDSVFSQVTDSHSTRSSSVSSLSSLDDDAGNGHSDEQEDDDEEEEELQMQCHTGECAEQHCHDEASEYEPGNKCTHRCDLQYTTQRKRLLHITGNSSRQRKGPSCDLCQLKKIKCDAYIEVLLTGEETPKGIKVAAHTANCKRVLARDLINRYITKDEESQGYKLLLANDKLIKFRNCGHCERKHTQAVFSRGYTKRDVMKYEEERGRSTKRKAYKKRKSHFK